VQAVEGVLAVALIRQETPATCTVGLRSRDSVDVAAIAARFGGGGHRQAAGLNTPGVIESIRARLLDAFAEIL
jgi:phosphoesterase RecJ-like protein